jgi:Protein of unknown function (DUF3667)
VSAPRLPDLLRAPWRAALALPTPVAPEGVTAECPGCGRPVVERYCGTCGEPRSAEPLSLGALLAAGVEHLTSLDGRLARTLVTLVRRPGQLAVEYRRGVRSRFTRPLQLFLLAVGAFYFAMSTLIRTPTTIDDFRSASVLSLRPRVEQSIRESHLTSERFFERLDGRANDVKRLLVLLFVPTLAASLALMYVGSGKYAVEHLVFATHYLTFLLLLFTAWKALVRLVQTALALHFGKGAGRVPMPTWLDTTMIVLFVLLALVLACTHLWSALRRAYGDSSGDAAARTAMLAVVVVAGVVMYRFVLYDVTLRLL